jgi:hypothetical protein
MNISIGLINWYIERHWFGNIIRNLLLPIWFDWKTKSIDFNGIPIGIIIILLCIF